ncbi:putative protein FAR1-RELATED SEQUENCE 10 [Lotus japonicus]|uniref:putative protein FAR1-RELATED SEQUENCE 10 n=1 Tax=Lotus japonicus TaxID=34305 RepID=UPI00258DD3C6|nr:putative protein FAR1-RELATED SEQUENCE 10 [Lotus japonicus]
MSSNTEVMLEGSINEDGRDLYDGATEDMEYSCDDNNVEQSESESYDEEGDDEDPGTDDASVSDESIRDMDYEQNDTDCYDDLEEPYGDYQDEDMSNNVEDRVAINSLNDILAMDLKNLVPVDMINYDFLDSDVAYLFYHWYGRANGFAVRKSRKVHSSIDGILLQQNYVCHREGKREDRGVTMENRKQKQRVDFRCGCNAKFRVHIDAETQRWYVKLFNDEHTHELVEDETCGMIAAYRKMTDTDILHMNNMLKVGIRTPQIHSSLASQTGGYMKVSCSKKGMYNVQARERRVHATDAGGACKRTSWLASKIYCVTYVRI